MSSEITSPGAPAGVIRPLPRQLTMVVLQGPDVGRHFPLDFPHAVIGRGDDCRVRLSSLGVSRRHAALWYAASDDLRIRDLDSRFGVYVEGRRVRQARVQHGARIQLSADTVILVRECDARENEILDQLKEAAMSDEVTGVSSRRYLLARLQEELSFAERHGAPFGLMLIDIDRFKAINDKLGHAVGDRALRFVAQALRHSIRNEDVIGRYGGDEFMLICRGLGAAQLSQLARRLCDGVLLESRSTDLPLSLSIGVVSHDPEQTKAAVLDLILRADTALYASKEQGRNKSTLWTPTLRAEVLPADPSRETMETIPRRPDS